MDKSKFSSGLIDGRVCVGAIAGPHGVRGAVRLKSFTAVAEDVASYGPLSSEDGKQQFKLHLMGSTGKGLLICRIDGVTNRNQSEALKGVRLFASRDLLPQPDEEEFYHADLIGLRADLIDGEKLGVIKAVYDFGAGDMLEILPEKGAIVMVPFTQVAVPVVNLAEGFVVINPPAGLLDPAEPEPSEQGTEKPLRQKTSEKPARKGKSDQEEG